MRILIIGEWYSHNLGDGVLCECVKYLIEENYADSKISIADLHGRRGHCRGNYILLNKYSNNVFIKKIVNPVLIYLSKKNNYINCIRGSGSLYHKRYITQKCNENYDFAVFAGGQLFLETFCISLLRYVKLLEKVNTKIIFNACGLGRIKDKFLKDKLQKCLKYKNIQHISMRFDENLFNNSEFKPQNIIATKTYDAALCAAKVYNVSKKKSEIIGLGFMCLDEKNNKILFELYNSLIKKLDEKNIRWEIFCNGSSSDYNKAKEFLEAYGYDMRFLSKRPLVPKGLVNLISKYNSIISLRLHSHIIAASLNIPSLGIAWDDKVRLFFDSMNCSDRCFGFTVKDEVILEKLLSIQNMNYDNSIIDKQIKLLKDNLFSTINNTAEK